MSPHTIWALQVTMTINNVIAQKIFKKIDAVMRLTDTFIKYY